MKLLCTETSCLSRLINYLMNKMRKNKLFLIGDIPNNLSGLFQRIKIETKKNFGNGAEDGIYFVNLDNDNINILNNRRYDCDVLIYDRDNIYADKLGFMLNHAVKCPLYTCTGDDGVIYFSGRTFEYNVVNRAIPETFRVLAIMHCYNEQDIIEESVEYIISQGLHIHVLDNWSTDDTYSILKALKQKYPERIILERFPKEGGSENYEWYNQLAETERIAFYSNYNWFIHYDVDEIRVSPWENTTLREAIFKIDSLGYNLIDNNVIDFRITDYSDENIFNKDSYFEFRSAENLLIQRKTWKKVNNLDLKTSGGHTAVVENPRIFPFKILNKHYPLRSITQARTKVFQDRLPRMRKERRTRGWHGHYDIFVQGKEFVYSAEELWKWDENTFTNLYLPLFTGIGICYETLPVLNEVDYGIHGKRLVIYGAGNVGKKVTENLIRDNEIIMWADKKYLIKDDEYCLQITNPEKIRNCDFDNVIIAIYKEDIYKEIKRYIRSLGVPEEKIIWLNE